MKPDIVLDTQRTYVMKTDDGRAHCHSCGYTWKTGDRVLLWPIRFKWFEHSTWSVWKVGNGCDGLDRVRFNLVIGLGRLRIILGPERYRGIRNLALERYRPKPHPADSLIAELESGASQRIETEE